MEEVEEEQDKQGRDYLTEKADGDEGQKEARLSSWGTLPLELEYKIFAMLATKDIGLTSMVCQRWHEGVW